MFFFFSSRRRHTRLQGDWSSDVCSSDLGVAPHLRRRRGARHLPQHVRPGRAAVPPAACLDRVRAHPVRAAVRDHAADRKSTRLNSSHLVISYAVFCLKKKTTTAPTSATKI